MNKAQVIASLRESREAFLRELEGLPEAGYLEPDVVGEWSVKDVLSHLSIWEAELVMLLHHFRRGRKPPSERFAKTVDELNAKWHAATRDRPLARVLDDFHGVRRQTIRQLEGLADGDLTRAPYRWMDGRPLWKWIAEDSFEHEAEHAADIRAWRARRGI
jgi:hypothetical protein